MASTAKLRKSSRVSSPAPKLVREAAAAAAALDAEEADLKKKTFMDKWVEPPLRSPVPSYQDYGLERGGVLEQMRPLGQMPPQKAQAQVKRLIHLKNGNLSSSTKEVPAPPAESTESTGSTKGESHTAERTRSQTPPAQSKPAAEKAAVRPPSKIFAVKPANTRLSIPTGVAATKDQQRLARIMEQAIDRANSVGDETMALALKKLFRDSFSDERLYQILETTLSPGTQTEAEQKVFQSYVKEARHLFKKPKSHSSSAQKSARSEGPASASPSKSPSKPQRSGAASGTRHMVNQGEATATLQPSITTASTSRSSTPTTRARRSEMNGIKSLSSTDKAQPDKDSGQRATRSKSNSSAVSSLTSIGSSEMEPSGAFRPPSLDGEADAQQNKNASRPENPALSQPTASSASSASSPSTDHHHHAHRSPGPKLHTFMTTSSTTNGHVKHSKSKSATSLKRDSAVADLDDDSRDAELAAKRKKYERTFGDAPIQESALRGSLVGGQSSITQPAGAKLSSAQLKNASAKALQLHSINGKRKMREEDDAPLSASSSAFGDHPVPSLSRPETPTNLGRPAKKAKKAPRVKTS